MKRVGFLFIVLIYTNNILGQGFFEGNDIISKTYSQRWELDSIDKKGTFRLVSYKSIYVAPARWTSNPNEKPQSENPTNSATETIDYDIVEVKFQLSLKTKLLQSIFWGKGDLWVGYTQIAHWQIYNEALSRPFREINYEPEIIFKYPLHIKAFTGEFKSIGISFTHQSNGRELPYSRSWNRVIFDLSYEIDSWIVSVRPWIRLSDGEKDDNPAITDYIGDGELNLSYSYNRHQFYTVITHPFNQFQGGSVQLNYIFPIKGHLRGHLQAFQGYGETLIDYNNKQTTIGIGVSFANW
ncbi:phospholipase A [Flavobacterium sp.]|uniref:phospholipase A n=1 Tax=Flavobacterium sp. TaxID=239 RepID=UPI0025B93C8D|nr:phospholipase A [Flavobacterium sp.]MBA4153576.1 phospholipase [Flavobacterium sp.]